jgi:hypothetical protein
MLERLYELFDVGKFSIVLKGIRHSGYHKMWETKAPFLAVVPYDGTCPKIITIKLLTRSASRLVLETNLRKF